MSLVTTVLNDPLTDFDRLFDDAFSRRMSMMSGNLNQVGRQGTTSGTRISRPAVDIHEDVENNCITVMFELAGARKEDVNIDVNNNVLTVSGEMKQNQERSEGGYVTKERRYGWFSRSIPMTMGIKPEHIKASMENGILMIVFPRHTPEQAPRKIKIA